MSKQPPTSAIALRSEQDRLQFNLRHLEKEILSIQEQLLDAQGTEREDSDWWHRAKSAKAHKEREHRITLGRYNRNQRKLDRIKPEARKAEARAALKEVIGALLGVARTSLAFYETDSDDTETAFTNALDHLDVVMPGWDEPQEATEEESPFRKVSLG